eukprot:3140328-Prymnesium_polylepis.3
MRNDHLGMIANTHLATADLATDGAKDSKCIRLAELHSQAVDFPKTGVPAQFPRELRLKSFPDFMGKKDGHKRMYKSQKVLGILYRSVSKAQEMHHLRTEYDSRFEFSGFDEHVPEAYRLREEYNFKLNALMNQFGVKIEGELMTGRILKFYRRHAKAKRKFDVQQQVTIAVKQLRKWARDAFNESVERAINATGEVETHDVIQFRIASAWYYVTYHPDVRNPLRLLSFPWTADTVLMRMARLPP